mmetsp:Transcript_95/g.76  ORF Transcript_95/g.76 Transcript_95/m.76 type:complete len:273 (+) Transcript_95:1-819(+)|eukprot:CAMPEP_0171309646 /NCGR_PEP_ID=MMETSP0816-20121228/19828_1 /TAXON_ID=420281 /ORGANISM="Proboscia inermis, Strain CCAP1064/1" /LENGTH=272 /DNA_ID=CAMNT_0011793329 /DNA_START=73 /DNA_END=891 /DNA_ORIENTATION=-
MMHKLFFILLSTRSSAVHAFMLNRQLIQGNTYCACDSVQNTKSLYQDNRCNDAQNGFTYHASSLRSFNFFDELEGDNENESNEVPEQNESINNESETDNYDEAIDSVFEDHIPQMNTVNLVGRVGQDPEPRYFDDGKVVVNIGLAVKRKYHPIERKVMNVKYGEEETDWFNLEIWGQTAEYVSSYVKKGARIGITGGLQIDAWTDRNTGEARQAAKIVVRELDILETKAEADLRVQNRGQYQSGGNTRSSNDQGDYDQTKRFGDGGGNNFFN